MKVKRIRIGLGATVNVGNYSNLRPELSMEFEVQEGDTGKQAAAAYKVVLAEYYKLVEAQLGGGMEGAISLQGAPGKYLEHLKRSVSITAE